MAFRIQIRRDTAASWAINNPVLLQAEMGYVIDTNQAKFGNGVDPWNDLPYFAPGGTGSGGSPINTYSSGTLVGTGVTGLNFTGAAVSSVTDTAGITTVSISATTGATGATGSPGATGNNGASGVYFVALEFSSGSLISSPFLRAEDDQGNSLIGASGWTFTRNSGSEITITFPSNNYATAFTRIVEYTNSVFLTASVGISGTTGNYVVQTPGNTSINIKGLTNSFTGINNSASGGTAPGTGWLMYITWTFPSNKIFYS